MKEIKITEIEGFKLGNAQNVEAATGCTAILAPQGAFAGVDVRGGSPASHETELLKPMNTVQQIHCVMLSGGSAYGLESTAGAMQFLEEKGHGFDTGFGLVPIVCGASCFDLELVTNKIRPDKAMGYEACKNAFAGAEFKQGNYGAGCGATVGKFRGSADMMKAGLGAYAVQVGDVKIGAIVALNALGDIYDIERKKVIAGILKPDHSGLDDSLRVMYDEVGKARYLWGDEEKNNSIKSVTNTTIACVITNARLDKVWANKLAQVAHNGYAKAILPTHTTADGDTIFAMASGQVEVGIDALLALSVEVMALAIRNAALYAAPAYGLKAASDFLK